MYLRLVLSGFLAFSLTACNIPGLTPEVVPTHMLEADGKATGSACRHALRSVENCYELNPKATRSSVFAGWKEMDVYMRENKLEGMPSVAAAPATEAVETPPPEKTNTQVSKAPSLNPKQKKPAAS